MTDPSAPASSPRPSTPASPTAASIPAASAEMRREHSEDRWARWAAKGASRDFVSKRRFQIIGGVIAVGLTVWFLWTR